MINYRMHVLKLFLPILVTLTSCAQNKNIFHEALILNVELDRALYQNENLHLWLQITNPTDVNFCFRADNFKFGYFYPSQQALSTKSSGSKTVQNAYFVVSESGKYHLLISSIRLASEYEINLLGFDCSLFAIHKNPSQALEFEGADGKLAQLKVQITGNDLDIE